MIKKKLVISIVLFAFFLIGNAQISIIGTQLLSYNVTPESMLSCSISNNGDEQEVSLTAKLYNFNNEIIFTVRSSSFLLKHGINTGFAGSRNVSVSEYSSSEQASYIKTMHSLPSGAFKICLEINASKTSEQLDDFCEVIESEFNQYLYLVYPADKDEIETLNPVLIWSHSEPFSILVQGEYYRMIVTKMLDKQNPEEAITINAPLMVKNYLTTHSLQYPYDAPALKAGEHYAWQVQKITNESITNKTEAWEFTIAPENQAKENKYSALRKTLDAGYYLAENNKVFFKFQENYSCRIISCKIYDSKRNLTDPKALNEGVENSVPNYKKNGDNRYEINLDEFKLPKGFYTLEVENEKREAFVLKFYVQ